MKKLIIIGAAAIALTSPTIAAAQTATFTTTGGTATVVGTTTYGANMQVGTSRVTHSNGTTTNESWTCISMSQPENAMIFDIHVVCDMTSTAGNYISNWGCNFVGEQGAVGCVGGLTGRTGAYAGKSGAATFAGTGGTGTGTMQWR